MTNYGWLVILGIIVAGFAIAAIQQPVTEPEGIVEELWYDISLCQVERPAWVIDRYSPRDSSSLSERGMDKTEYENESILINWNMQPYGISFSLRNKTDAPIRIIWEQAALIGFEKKSASVTHLDMPQKTAFDPLLPTVVASCTHIEDKIIPSRNIDWSSSGWRITDSWLPVKASGEELKSVRGVYCGKLFSILLPIEVEGIINDYVFTFRINAVGQL
ncbi:MAG: hypothetical protein U9Q23_04380 [Candidatus Bipolaricaulota bacterium]|nr:hypothetical protein [Candidatus Bipolaricaulota bacterium]